MYGVAPVYKNISNCYNKSNNLNKGTTCFLMTRLFMVRSDGHSLNCVGPYFTIFTPRYCYQYNTYNRLCTM